MAIEIKKVETKADRKKFVNFQFELYKGQKNWVPPLKKGEIDYLDPAHNPAYKFSEAEFYIAIKDGKVVGRIGAAVNKLYNEKVGKKYVRIVKPEFIDDEEVFDALIKTVEDFGKKHGMELCHGPLGFTNLDTQGLLIEGFNELQSVASVYHLPYYKKHFERNGYEKENDWVEFRLTLDDKVINKGQRVKEIVRKRYGFETINFTSTDEMKSYAPKIFEILNDAFSVLPYVVELDKEMQEYYTAKYFDIINPKYVKAVKKEDDLVGFIIAVPSMSKAMQKANGHLFPFGIFHIMKARKENTVADLFLTGVKKKYQSDGVAVILFAEMQKAIWDNGIREFETTGVFETNKEVINNWKSFQHRLHKRRRCFVKKINL